MHPSVRCTCTCTHLAGNLVQDFEHLYAPGARFYAKRAFACKRQRAAEVQSPQGATSLESQSICVVKKTKKAKNLRPYIQHIRVILQTQEKQEIEKEKKKNEKNRGKNVFV